METITDIKFDYDLLVSLTRKLTELVNAEADLLSQMKVSDIKEIQIQKNEVAGKLEKQQNFLRNNPKFRETLSAEQKDTLREIAIAFDIAIQNYQERLYKAQRINQMILDKMVQHVREHVEKKRSYNRRGLKTSSGMELAKNTPAIKFNSQA